MTDQATLESVVEVEDAPVAEETLDTVEWSKSYQDYLDNPPKPGDVLRAMNEDARLDLELHEGKQPFVYGRAYVPCVVGEPLGWRLHGISAENAFGLKCILLPKAREELLRNKGVQEPIIQVKALRVVRWSQSKQSILCEVAEY